ncbi:MAG: sulfatase-like hydrolase/transferase [Phycisphaera sp.]|nr:sulfatase-like hydrolase/transferase [Phycisphaera sp.]
MLKNVCLFVCVGALVVIVAGPRVAHAADQPNIVILLADDLGYGETTAQGAATDVPTPHIDSIARDGVRFTQGYVSASYCSASRAGLLTGRIQTRFGHEFNPTGAKNELPGYGLPPDEQTLADLLHDAGYTTGLVGKWHVGGAAPYHPQRRGFDEFYGFMHEGHYFAPEPWKKGVTTFLRRRTLPGGGADDVDRWTSPDGKLIYSTAMHHDEPDYDANNPIVRAGRPVDEPLYLTDALTREAVDFIERTKGRPFFLMVAYNAVHSPMQGADAYMKKFAHIEDAQRRIFAAMLANLDDSVGAVLGKLRDEGLEKDTLVIFLSDNGGPTRELTSSNAPLRGEKSSVYEGGTRVPFMMRWSGVLPKGLTYDKPVVSLDVLPTAAAISGARLPKKPIDGVNLMPFLLGEKGDDARPHDVFFWRQGTRTAVRVGDWKLLRNPDWGEKSTDWELYDLATDVSETTDLSKSEPGKVAELEKVWTEMNGQMIEALFR